MTAYYNEYDPHAAAWLRELIKHHLIAPGVVDERSIEDVEPGELAGFTQCHFFAGIGGWSLALRRAGWPDDRPVWTGSCPCQPFSAAGQGAGFADERHLWPAFHHLIRVRRPAVVIGEQVAGRAAEPWIDLVQVDLEALGYAFGAVPFPSASVGAPHIRDRLYWVADASRRGRGIGGGALVAGEVRHPDGDDAFGGLADTDSERQPRPAWLSDERPAEAGTASDSGDGRMGDACGARLPLCERQAVVGARGREEGRAAEQPGGASGGMADNDRLRQQSQACQGLHDGEPDAEPRSCAGRVADACGGRLSEAGRGPVGRAGESGACEERGAPGPTNGHWRDADWLFCRDGKWRPVEPGTFPLADGLPGRVGRLRGYGNAVNVEAARVFIEAAGL